MGKVPFPLLQNLRRPSFKKEDNDMAKLTLLLLLIAAVCLIGTGFAEEESDPVLARMGERKITLSDLNRIIAYYPQDKQTQLLQNPQNKATLLRRVVQGMVLSQSARDEGFDKQADVREQVEMLVNDFIATEYLRRKVVEKIVVTEDDMKSYYKTYQDDFKTPEMVKARHILIRVDKSASAEDKGKAKEKAGEILKKIKAGGDFVALAAEVSEDPGSKTKGGDLGFFARGRMMPEFEKAAFSLKVGEVSEVIETPYGFHIIKLEEKREAAIEPYEKVKERVREKVFNEFKKAKVENFLEKTMNAAKAELNLDPLSR